MINGITTPLSRREEIPQWMQDLCGTITGSMSGDRLKNIIDAQVRKAEAGNTSAAVFCLELFAQAQKVRAMTALPVPATATEVPASPGPLEGVEFDILCRLEDAGGCLNLEDLALGIEQDEPGFVVEEVIKGLIERGLMTSRKTTDGRRYRITVAGSAALK